MRHIQGLVRQVNSNERLTRLAVVDHIVNLVDAYLSGKEADKIMELYLSLMIDDAKYQYSDFKALMKDINTNILAVEDLPKMVKARFKVYMEYLFPVPIPP